MKANQVPTIADKIMKRIRGHGRGGRVYTTKVFLDLGSRAAVDKAMSRLANDGTIRRLRRGMYDWPRQSALLNRPAPASVDAVVAAVTQRTKSPVLPNNLHAANALGLTNAVPANPHYVATDKIKSVVIGGRTVRFSPMSTTVKRWADSPALMIVQALIWLHDNDLDGDDDAVRKLRDQATPAAKAALRKRITDLPSWAIPRALQIAGNRAKMAV